MGFGVRTYTAFLKIFCSPELKVPFMGLDFFIMKLTAPLIAKLKVRFF